MITLLKKIRINLIAIFALIVTTACSQVEDRISKITGNPGRTYSLSLIELIVDGPKYDNLQVGVGGYLGRGLDANLAIYFVPEHLIITDLNNGVQLVFDNKSPVFFEDFCEAAGSYIRVTGKYKAKQNTVNVKNLVKIKEKYTDIEILDC